MMFMTEKDTSQSASSSVPSGSVSSSTPSTATIHQQRKARRKWTSAFRVMQSLHRLKHPPMHHHQHHAHHEKHLDHSAESTPLREFESSIDPVYLALKQATGRYGRRGSSAQMDSTTPSPRNLSDASLQDSGYAEISYSRGQMAGSTPQLDQSDSGGRKRPPKLHKQMKSLSLDCADPTPITNTMRSRSKLAPTTVRKNSSDEISDWDRSRSPSGPSPRTTPRRISSVGCTHVVIHEYFAGPETALYLGDRLQVVDNGDPDWLHGFKSNGRSDRLITFPSTCVALVQPGEQTMLLRQNVHIAESKMRLYRDQVVFAQPDSLKEGRVLVRTERNAFVHCPLQYLMLV